MSPYEAAQRDGFPRAIADEASTFLGAVYGWMCAGLVMTAFFYGSPATAGSRIGSEPIGKL